MEADGRFQADRIVNGRRLCYSSLFQPGYDCVLGCNDASEFLKSMLDGSVSLAVTSPPYNLGKPYEQRVALDEYLDWQKTVITECVRTLKPDGSMCWETGNYVENGEVYPLDAYFYHIFKNLGLKLRNRIIWRFGHGLHTSRRFSGRYETILWFTKGNDYTFNLDPVRVPQKYPGKRHHRGPRRGQISGNPLGKNPSDMWDMLVSDWTEEVWDIPNVKSNHPEKTVHPAQYPIELVERLVLALTNEEDVVLDPFAGSGTSLVASILHKRKAVGVDRERVYTDVAYKRVISALTGTLRRRPLGQRVFIPKGTEKVATIPAEWKRDFPESGALS